MPETKEHIFNTKHNNSTADDRTKTNRIKYDQLHCHFIKHYLIWKELKLLSFKYSSRSI